MHFEERNDLFLYFWVNFSPSENVVAMATREGLSF